MKKYLLILCTMSIFMLDSCLVPKKVVYVKDMEINRAYNTIPVPPIRIQKNDRLNIHISSKNPELALPFNQDGVGYNITEKGNITAVNGSFATTGYLVDYVGNIEFPILGTLNVEGMTLDGLQNHIRDLLVNQKLISTPIVRVELINLRIIMMGEVTGVGVLEVPDSKITLLEAITKSGGLSKNAKADEIMVIREENGVRKMYVNDIEDVKIFNSPVFHLQQNDIVYVKPKTAEFTPREQATMRYFGIITGFLALGTTIYAILSR